MCALCGELKLYSSVNTVTLIIPYELKQKALIEFYEQKTSFVT